MDDVDECDADDFMQQDDLCIFPYVNKKELYVNQKKEDRKASGGSI